MPALGTAYAGACDAATGIPVAIEMARNDLPVGSLARAALTPTTVHAAYEAAFLRLFAEWETFLEEATIRFMCGYYTPTHHPTAPGNVGFATSLPDASQRLYGNHQYLLWHRVAANINRVQGWLVQSPIETVFATGQQFLTHSASVRHRIAHHSTDARGNFNQATLALAGVRFPGASAGRFLRSPSPAGHRWLVELSNRMKGLALQIAP